MERNSIHVSNGFWKEARFPYAIGYGLTETAPLLAGAGTRQTKLQSTGFAVQGVHLKLNNPDKKGVGEIWAKGPNVMQGYYKNARATSEVLTKDGWFKTGDYGRLILQTTVCERTDEEYDCRGEW